MKKYKEYETPEMEILLLGEEDIITTSSDGDELTGTDDNETGWN